MAYKIPTKKQAELYVKLRKKGFNVKVSDDLMKQPSLAKKVLNLKIK
jgi:hypothetical protein